MLYKWQGNWLRRAAFGNGWAHHANCCCDTDCKHSECCAMLQVNERFFNLTMDVHSELCGELIGTTLPGSNPWTGTFSGGDAITVWCEATDDPKIINLIVNYYISNSEPCEYTETIEKLVECYPFDEEFLFHTSEQEGLCCGDVTIRVYGEECDPDFYMDCTFDSFCIGKVLHLKILALNPSEVGDESNCSYRFKEVVDVELNGEGCSWEGTVCLQGAGAEENATDCCYKFVLVGEAADNRYCDFYLSIYDENEGLVYGGRATSGIPEGMRLEFPNWEPGEPCCTGLVTLVIEG